MDIEGSEYEVLLTSPQYLIDKFRVLIIEFHGLHNLWNRPFFNLAKLAFQKILINHTCVHIHPNNTLGLTYRQSVAIPQIMEFTFLRNDRISFREYQRSFPHTLDCENSPMPPITLPSNWYST